MGVDAFNLGVLPVPTVPGRCGYCRRVGPGANHRPPDRCPGALRGGGVRARCLADQPDLAEESPIETRGVHVYRALCLLALGNRSGRPRRSIKSSGPIRSLSHPRIILRGSNHWLTKCGTNCGQALTRAYYQSGKDKLAAGDYRGAANEFTLVLSLADAAHDRPGHDYADFRLLAGDFRGIAERAIAEEKLVASKAAGSTAAGEPKVIPPVVIRQGCTAVDRPALDGETREWTGDSADRSARDPGHP